MPELPEVETVCKVLRTVFIGHTIKSVDVLRCSAIDGDVHTFTETIKNNTVNSITRIGKHIIFHLSNDLVVLAHLRMEGKFFEYEEDEENSKYARVVFHLDNGKKVCFDDSRSFGRLRLSTEKSFLLEKEISKLGKEPFDIHDVRYLEDKAKKLSQPVKQTIMDQTFMAGLGNIYADEVLFASKVHPLTPTNKVTNWQEILANSVSILNLAIISGGSTIKSYHPGKNIDGNFQVNLKVYGKKDEPCPICGTKLKFLKIGGRGTTFCPHCQKQTGAISVAIFGNIASGKSTVLEIFKNIGYKTISADKIVETIYQQEKFKREFAKKFNLVKVDDVKAMVKEMIQKDKLLKNAIEDFVFPYVKKAIINAKNTCNTELFVAEVPLLFESHLDKLFDYIIAVDIDPETQIKRLKERSKENAEFLYKLNKNNKFDKNKEKADFIINNSGSLCSLNAQVKLITNKLLNHQD